MNRKILFITSFLFFSYFAKSQSRPERVRIDEHLFAWFPGHVQRIDSLGFTLFHTTVKKITYQIVMQDNIIQDGANEDRKSLMKDAAQMFLNLPKFNNLAKLEKDSVIGGLSGKFITMTRLNAVEPYQVFLFITMRQRTMYSIQLTSFNTQNITVASAYFFYSNVEFHRSK